MIKSIIIGIESVTLGQAEYLEGRGRIFKNVLGLKGSIEKINAVIQQHDQLLFDTLVDHNIEMRREAGLSMLVHKLTGKNEFTLTRAINNDLEMLAREIPPVISQEFKRFLEKLKENPSFDVPVILTAHDDVLTDSFLVIQSANLFKTLPVYFTGMPSPSLYRSGVMSTGGSVANSSSSYLESKAEHGAWMPSRLKVLDRSMDDFIKVINTRIAHLQGTNPGVEMDLAAIYGTNFKYQARHEVMLVSKHDSEIEVSKKLLGVQTFQINPIETPGDSFDQLFDLIKKNGRNVTFLA